LDKARIGESKEMQPTCTNDLATFVCPQAVSYTLHRGLMPPTFVQHPWLPLPITP